MVKLLHPVSHIPPNIQQVIAERFAQEAAALEYLGDSIDGVPKLYAYFEERGEFYLIQELITGKTLDDKVKTEGPYTERQCIEFLADFLKLLGEIHSRRVIHRDIKPSNIIIRNHDNKPFLIDFGIVKEVMTVTLDSPMRSHIFGTPGYAPYEQALGKPVYATDIYSLGMSCIYLVTGKQPATMVNQLDGQIEWRGFVEGINHDFALLIDKATETDFRNRYKTAFEMLAAVNSLPPQTVPTHDPRFDGKHTFADEPRNTPAPRQRLDQRSENDSNPSAWPVLPDQQNVDEGNKPGFAATGPAVSTSRTLPLGYDSPDQTMPFVNSKGTPVGPESRPRSFVRFYTVAFTGAGLIAMVLIGCLSLPVNQCRQK